MHSETLTNSRHSIDIKQLSTSLALRFKLNNSHQAFWWPPELEQAIKKRLDQYSLIYITGKALSGKSRLILEFAKTLPDGPAVIVNQQFMASQQLLKLDLHPDALVIIDDLNEILALAHATGQIDDLNTFLTTLIAKNTKTIIAGRNNLAIKEALSIGYLTNDICQKLTINRLQMPPLNKVAADSFKSFWSKELKIDIDQISLSDCASIGDYFVNTSSFAKKARNTSILLAKSTIKKSWKTLPSQYVNSALNALYLLSLSNKYGFSTVDSSMLEATTEKIYQKHQQQAKQKNKFGYNPFQSFFSDQNSDNTDIEKGALWPLCLDFLSSTEGLSVLGWQENEPIISYDRFLVELWFQQQKVDNQVISAQQIENIKRYFDSQEQSNLNFWHPDRKWYANLLTLQAIDINTANDLLLKQQQKSASTKDDFYGARIILQKITPFNGAVSFYKKHTKELADNSWASILLQKVSSFKNLETVLEIYKELQVELEAGKLLDLLPKMSNWSEQKKLLSIVAKIDLPLIQAKKNLIQLLKASEDLSSVLSFLNEHDIKLNDNDIKTLFSKTKRWRDVQESKKLINDHSFDAETLLNEKTVSTYLSNSPVWEETKDIKELAEKKNIQLTLPTYNQILRNVPNYEEALAIKKELQDKKIQLNRDCYNLLIAKSNNIYVALELYKEMQDQSIKPNLYTFFIILRLARGNMQYIIYQKLSDQMITPNYRFFRLITLRSHKWPQTLQWLYEMLSWNILPTEDILEAAEKQAVANSETLPPEWQNYKQNIQTGGQQNYKHNFLFSQNSNPNVFMSYAHRNMEKKDLLHEKLINLGVNCFFDVKNDKFKDTLPKFLNRPHFPKWVAVIIDQTFWHSPYCMSELVYAVKNPKLRRQVLIFSNSKEDFILDEPKIKEYLSFWENKKNKLMAKITENPKEQKTSRELQLTLQIIESLEPCLKSLQKMKVRIIDENLVLSKSDFFFKKRDNYKIRQNKKFGKRRTA